MYVDVAVKLKVKQSEDDIMLWGELTEEQRNERLDEMKQDMIGHLTGGVVEDDVELSVEVNVVPEGVLL